MNQQLCQKPPGVFSRPQLEQQKPGRSDFQFRGRQALFQTKRKSNPKYPSKARNGMQCSRNSTSHRDFSQEESEKLLSAIPQEFRCSESCNTERCPSSSKEFLAWSIFSRTRFSKRQSFRHSAKQEPSCRSKCRCRKISARQRKVHFQEAKPRHFP